MKNIKKIRLSHMRQQQVFEFFDRVCSCIAPVTPEFTIYHDELKKAHKEFEDTLSYHQKSILTEKIHQTDKDRNFAWRALRTAINSLLLLPTEGYEDSIKEMDIILNTYGNPARMPNTEQSGIIKNLIDDLLTRIDKDTRKDLGLNNLINDLQEINKTYVTYLLQRQQERTDHIPGIASIKRKEVEKAYRNMTKALEVLYNLDESNGDFKTFITDLNLLIDEENIIIKARQTRNKNKSESTSKSTSKTNPKSTSKTNPK